MKKVFLILLLIFGTIFCAEQKDKGISMERHVKYKNIVFDFGGVLTQFPLQKVFQDIFTQEEEVMPMELWQELFWCDPFAELQRGNITAVEALKSLPEKYNKDQVVKFFYSLHAYLIPVPQVINLVKLLKEKGYKLFLLSNSGSDIDFDKPEYNFLKSFDGLVFSHEVHAIKPDPEIYHILFDTHKIKAEECLFIDDFEKNIIGAKAVGMNGIVCSDHDLMIKELRELGLLRQDEIDSLYSTQNIERIQQMNEKIKKQINHPQEPKPPYPYNEEEVIYKNKNANVILSGTLTTPQDQGTFPAVILIAGSGPHKRDAEKYGNKMFLVLADHLTRKGIAVLRFDKRGCGKSTGNFKTSTIMDFANDVEAGIKYLKSREDIDPNKIGLIGHSEGGMVASILAAKSKDLAFVVMLASTGVMGDELLYEECMALAKGAKEPKEAIAVGSEFLLQMCDIIKKEADDEKAKEKTNKIYEEYLTKLPEAQRKIAKSSVFYEALGLVDVLPYIRFFLSFNPALEVKKIKIPVLAFFCERDLMVPQKQNLPPFKKALKESGNQDYKVLLMPELNHRFQHCKIGTEEEYAEIEETISPEVLKIISEWILAK